MKSKFQPVLIKSISIFFIFSVVYGKANANDKIEIALSQASGKLIIDVFIQGNHKTKNAVIERELDFSKGEIFAEKKVLNSLRKLRNLRIFEDVAIKFFAKNSTTVEIHIIVSDRWTVIPIAKLGGGGGANFYVIGAFDVNSFGRYIELGAQYQNINGKDGGVVWFRNPRFLGQRLLFGIDLWQFMLNQPIYNADGDLSGAFNNTKKRVHFFTKKQLSRWLFIGGGIDYVIDSFDDFGLTDEQAVVNREVNFALPKDVQQNYIELNMQLGELNYDRFLVAGWQTNIDTRTTAKKLYSDENSVEVIIKNTYFKKLKHQQNIGANLVVAHTTSDLLQNQFYLGGLLEVRGYVDRRFRGSNYWKANFEYRVPSYRSRWFVLQHVAFTDFGAIANSFGSLFDSGNTYFSSIGAGLRFISPKIYRFNARLDVARALADDGGFDVSFGLQQFF